MYFAREYLGALYRYDSETGKVWRDHGDWWCSVGTRKMHNIYHSIQCSDKSHLLHRFIWFIVTGVFPTLDIDHVDGDGLSNRWDNLREATGSQNAHNSKVSIRNTSGVRGVSLYVPTGKWVACITVDYTYYHLGYFEAKEEAIVARRQAEGKFQDQIQLPDHRRVA